MWILGFWQDLRDAAQAVELLSRAYAAIASVKKNDEDEDEDDAEAERITKLEQEIEKLKSQLQSLKKKKVVKRKK